MKIKDIYIKEPIHSIEFDRRLWITTKEFTFSVLYENGFEFEFVIPEGLVLDFYSIPRPLHFWRSNRPGWGETASAIHDFLRRFYNILGLSVKDTDVIFKLAMEHYGLRTRYIKYGAVRAFAWLIEWGNNGGNGKPATKVLRAMEKNNICWQDYRDEVIDANFMEEKQEK